VEEALRFGALEMRCSRWYTRDLELLRHAAGVLPLCLKSSSVLFVVVGVVGISSFRSSRPLNTSCTYGTPTNISAMIPGGCGY